MRLPHFGVSCDLLLNTDTKRFVIYLFNRKVRRQQSSFLNFATPTRTVREKRLRLNELPQLYLLPVTKMLCRSKRYTRLEYEISCNRTRKTSIISVGAVAECSAFVLLRNAYACSSTTRPQLIKEQITALGDNSLSSG